MRPVIHTKNNPFLWTQIMHEIMPLSKILKQAKQVSNIPTPSISTLAVSALFLLPAAQIPGLPHSNRCPPPFLVLLFTPFQPTR